ncbi:DUF5666 domain-containing protein [Salinisphaera aquimarina]|uniref:DUF5666 domain-containing protein n=1 Tax=Salinisphaera aquimarina TaxID=2094031 RepID=A0ABV7EQ10_9GAMM
MMGSSAGKPRVRSLLAALIAGALIVACGGGADGGSGQLAGIEGTGIVSGFGSVYVNGIEFATTDASITVDGEPASESRLRVGNVVRVAGRIDKDGNARADRIVFDRSLDGPIARIEVAPDGTGELAALGQTVRFDGNTVFVNTPAGDLEKGDLIAVSGLGDDGSLRATTIQQGPTYVPGTTRIDVEGIVRDLDGSSFQLGTLRVNYSGATIEPGADALRNGTYVQVFGAQNGDDDALNADSVATRARAQGDDGEQLFLEGLIGDFAGLSDFSVNGQRVDASDAERTDTAPLAPGAGVSISIRGSLRGDVLVADSFAVQPSPEVMLQARLDDVNAPSDGLELLSTRWTVRADTLYNDERSDNAAGNDRQLRIDRLASGDTVTVHGYMGRTGLVMTRLERVADDAQGNAQVRGPIDSIARNGDGGRIVVAGAEIQVSDATTVFLNAAGQAIDADNFFAEAAPGTVIKAIGPDNGSRIDIARSVQLNR